MIAPLDFAFEVAASAEHCFRTWTERIDRWWPATHSESGDADLTVHLEPKLGGRLFERTAAGVEHEWGEVTLWEPPRRFGYLWHIRRAREESTDVVVSFEPLAPSRTRVDIHQASWERVGSDAPTWRDRNEGAWTSLFPHFIAYAEATVDTQSLTAD
jgi:hypothetical protein